MLAKRGDISKRINREAYCGINIRNDSKHSEIYYKIKDARSSARSLERNVGPGEPMRLAPEWHDVNNFGLQVLEHVSKDVEILAWVAEAQIRLNGFSGLRDLFLSCCSLFAEHWEDIHSVETDDVAEKVGPFAGLNGVSGEGTLIQAIRLAPLIPGAGFARFTLWDYQLAQRENEIERREMLYDEAQEVGQAAMAEHLKTVTGCLEAYERLVSILDEQCGDAAPPSANTRNVLFEAAAAIRVLAGLSDQVQVAPVSEAAAAETAAPDQADPGGNTVGEHLPHMINSREEAFEILLSVARFFRRSEPHSPISMSIETLVRRGRMDFSELLAELLPEPQARKSVLTAAGIQPKSEGES
ncbi:type VI secretion system protein TssA [Nitratireductor sp. ZSWI3]|uniref:type VI secretion system protein TssA n=1 Tax=Nitratireductor sp. ZSWI3 TaxID=2966359 RepID=UPI00214F6FB5|nr:type VI secretion system protein TssA [Nitratireductor sp. ZSWI3]MCR4266318.1 type VI secretion system protein TssA [Nitratireductor sp. ZSWI3]